MEKVYDVHRCLSLNRHGATKERLKQAAGSCSDSTLFRILRFMRTELGAPIGMKPRDGIFRYQEGVAYELPGIWLKGDELASLAELLHRLEELQAEFLSGAALRPFIEKLESLLKSRKVSPERMGRKIRFLQTRAGKVDGNVFRTVMEALFNGERLFVRHEDRTSGALTDRMVSPQKMVRYRDNWYLDGYCHLRENLRSFALSGIREVRKSQDKSKEIPEEELQDHFASAYGIFGGRADKTAEILLTGIAARISAREPWHPSEERSSHPDGGLLLRIPYRDSRELIGDILRHAEDVEVLGPPELRTEIIKKLKKVSEKYAPNNSTLNP